VEIRKKVISKTKNNESRKQTYYVPTEFELHINVAAAEVLKGEKRVQKLHACVQNSWY
jgi:hypothetical protein